MDCRISTEVRPPEAVVTVAGELDVFTSRQLRDRLHDALDRGCPHIRLDLGDVRFADAAALRELSRFDRLLDRSGGSLHIVAWSPQVRRLCRLAGIDKGWRRSDATPA